MNNPATRKPLTTFATIFLVLASLFTVGSAYAFLRSGQNLHDLLFVLGIPLISFGVYKNGLKARAYKTQDPTFDRRAQYVADVGLVVVLIAVILRFLK